MAILSSEGLQDFIEENTMDTPKGRTAKVVAKHLGLKLESTLGIGSQGEAYLMSDGRVIKVTDDDSEYYASKRIVGMEIPHVNIIYRCIRVKYKGIVRNCIIQKFASQEKREEIRCFEDDTDGAQLVKSYCTGWCDWDEVLDSAESIKAEWGDNYAWEVDQYLGIAKHVKEDAGYDGSDFFYRNSGWDADREQIVMIDLGYSSVTKPDTADEVLELK